MLLKHVRRKTKSWNERKSIIHMRSQISCRIWYWPENLSHEKYANRLPQVSFESKNDKSRSCFIRPPCLKPSELDVRISEYIPFDILPRGTSTSRGWPWSQRIICLLKMKLWKQAGHFCYWKEHNGWDHNKNSNFSFSCNLDLAKARN